VGRPERRVTTGPAPPRPRPDRRAGHRVEQARARRDARASSAEIEQAARPDVGQLAISPQRGFASVSEGNELRLTTSGALEVVARTADEVWGPAG
jgi:hypothetical protein